MNNIKIFVLLTLFITLSSSTESEVQMIESTLQNNKTIDGAEHILRNIAKTAVSPSSCLSKLYVMAFTSSLKWADSDSSHYIEIQYGNHDYERKMALYNRPGDDYLRNKGDLWELSLSGCIKLPEIRRVSIVEGGNDGWNIGSIVTLVSDSSNVQLLTRDFNVNRWIDGDGPSSHEQFDLSLSPSEVNAGSCLSRLYVMAFTSDLSGASSDTSHSIKLHYNGGVKTMSLYDRPGDDYMSNKGDLWELTLSGCIKIRDIQRVSIVANGNDGWNIESIVTLVRDSSNIQVLTENFDVNRWIDGDGPSSQRQFYLKLPHDGPCLSKLYVMAFTSNLRWANSDTNHKIELQYNGGVLPMALYNRPGDDYLQNKGDLWELSLSSCVRLSEIHSVSVVEDGNDGWNIESIVTLVGDPTNKVQLLTQNFHVNRWIDGDGPSSHRRFALTLSLSKVNEGSCLSKLYVVAFTSGRRGGSSDTSHGIQLQYSGGMKTMSLYNRPGDDYMSNKGDLWELTLSGCIKIRDLQRVSIVEDGNDGWNIESIVTLVRDSSSNIQLLTQDFDVNCWIDGDSAKSHQQLDLTLPGVTIPPVKCNGMEGLCNLRIDQVTFPGAHNAGAGFNGVLYYSNNLPAISCFYRNVNRNFYVMLKHGIRFFDIDTCIRNGRVESCHGDAYAGPLSKAFDQIDNYMKCHKNEVIILHFNRDVQGDRRTVAKKLVAELEKRWNPEIANNPLKMHRNTHQKWPTLREAIETKQRIFIFMDDNLAQYIDIRSKPYIYNRNGFFRSTYDSGITVTPFIYTGCSGIIDSARRKCNKYGKQDIIELAGFGSISATSILLNQFYSCVDIMAKVCSRSLRKAADECYKQRQKHQKTVNVLLVDYPVSEYDPKQSVVDVAKAMNAKNIKNFSG